MTDKTLFTAMAKAFPKIEGALRDTDNPAFKRDGKFLRYADLSSVVAAIKPALSENGLFFCQITHEHDGGVCVETMIGHESGERMSFGKLFVPASKNDAQGYGSALTYCRRYSLMAAFGVCPEDDDGNAAAASAPKREESKPAAITDAQRTKIIGLVEATKSNLKPMLDHFKVGDLSELTDVQGIKAINQLEGKLAKMAKESTQTLADELNDEVRF